MIDILTLNYNDAETTLSFVNKVKNYACVSHVVVVDNASTDDSYNQLKTIESDRVVLIRSNSNNGYGAGNNIGIRYIKGHFHTQRVLLANPDVIIEEEVLLALDKYMSVNMQCAIAAPFMCDKQGNKQPHSAFKLPTLSQYVMSLDILTSKFHTPMRYKNLVNTSDEAIKVGAVSGSCFMLDVDKFIEVGGFDERIFLYCEEVVLGKKMQSHHYDITLCPQLCFIHNHSVTISKNYRSKVSRKALLYKSKLFVIEHYFNASVMVMLMAKGLSKISLLMMSCRDMVLSVAYGNKSR